MIKFFFKKYNFINLEILNNIIKNANESDKLDLHIEPKYLAMIHMKYCDFCDNEEDDDTYIESINFYYGYQVCPSCTKKNIGKTYIKKWFADNSSLPCNKFLNFIKENYTILNINLKIQRSSGMFEDDWYLDSEGTIKYVIKDDESEDILFPLYKSFDNPRKRGITKTVYLSELCRFNTQLNESDIIKKFKLVFEKFKSE